jgi:hypothetical protein
VTAKRSGNLHASEKVADPEHVLAVEKSLHIKARGPKNQIGY